MSFVLQLPNLQPPNPQTMIPRAAIPHPDNPLRDTRPRAQGAAAATRGGLDGAVFHSDHGAQYTSKEFAVLSEELGVTQSMGAVGTSADNAACESFHASLKREILQGARRWDGPQACRLSVFR